MRPRLRLPRPRFAILIVGLVACVGSRDDRPRPDTAGGGDTAAVATSDVSGPMTPCPAGGPYSLSDTGAWATAIEEGRRAVLRVGTATIDTVDVAFGVHAVGRDSLLFLPVRAYDVDSAEAATMSAPAASPEEHVLCTPEGRRALSTLVPHFNSGFSSPSVIDSTLYYWGLSLQDAGGRYRLYAIRHSARDGRVDSVFLREETPATDFRYFSSPPFERDGAIVFEGGEGRVLIDREAWRILAAESRPTAPGNPR